MKKYNISKDTLDNDFNKLLLMYEQDNKSESILHEVGFFNKYLLKNKHHYSYNLNTGNKNLNLEIDRLYSLTKTLCANVLVSLEDVYYSNKLLLKNNKVKIDDIYSKIINFLSIYFKDDVSLANHLFEEERIKISKSLINTSQMFYLRNLKEYYIKILYNGKLSEREMSHIIHEIGHISEFTFKDVNTFLPESVLGETIANLYEFKYINYLYSNDDNKKIANIVKLFFDANFNILDYNYCSNGKKDILIKKMLWMY